MIGRGVRDEILDQFVSRSHGFFEECNHDVVKLFLEKWISFKVLQSDGNVERNH
jgi:hypothetical protein